jgi:hypothetical protein
VGPAGDPAEHFQRVAYHDDAAEIMRLAREIHDRTIPSVLEPAHDGEFVVINVDSGEFVHSRDEARRRLDRAARQVHRRRALARSGAGNHRARVAVSAADRDGIAGRITAVGSGSHRRAVRISEPGE